MGAVMSGRGALREGVVAVGMFVAGMAAACGGQEAIHAPPISSVGSPAWAEVRRPTPWFTDAVAVIDGRQQCTAWHAGGGLLVTARHCVEGLVGPGKPRAAFDMIKEVAWPDWRPIGWPGEEAQPGGDIDVTFLKVEKASQVCLRVAAALPGVGERIVVVHQTCDPEPGRRDCRATKKISWGQVTSVEEEGRWFRHDAETRPRSSGAPVMRDDGSFEVLGIHFRGEPGTAGFAVSIGLVAAGLGGAGCP